MINSLRHFTEHSEISPLTKITKLMPAINELPVYIYLNMLRTKTNLVRGDFAVSLLTQRDFGGTFQNNSHLIERYDCESKMQMLIELFLKLFYIQIIEIRNKKYYEENKEHLKKGKVRFRLIDVRKEKEESWLNGLNAIKTKIAFVKDRLNFSRISWIMYQLPSQCTCICFFTSFSFQTYISAALIHEGAKTLKSTTDGILWIWVYNSNSYDAPSQVKGQNCKVEIKKIQLSF